MQTWTATITDIQPIPNKDRIVLATVNGYQAIVGADTYKVGDTVVYISEQSIVPEWLQDELGLTGRLSGGNKDRVKTIKMGGVYSQGIICKPGVWQLEGCPEGDDFDALLGIVKYEPTIPMHLSGKVGRPRGNAPIAPMYDIENIKKQRHLRHEYNPQTGDPIEGTEYWADPFIGQEVIVTEKLHGTNFACHMNLGDTEPYVYSKGLGKQGHVLLDDDVNAYWRALKMYPQIVDEMRSELVAVGCDSMTVRGEIIGTGIQDLDYGIGFDLVLFAVEYHYEGITESFHPETIGWDLYGVPIIPIRYYGIYDYDECVEMSMGSNLYGETGKHVREGVVVAHATQYRQMNGLRYAAKFINPDYLVRKGGSEFN
jgi:RNA ligase (TIGR02306 family)